MPHYESSRLYVLERKQSSGNNGLQRNNEKQKNYTLVNGEFILFSVVAQEQLLDFPTCYGNRSVLWE